MSTPEVPLFAASKAPSKTHRTPAALWIARGAAILASGIAAYLTYASLAAGGQVLGCGDSADSGCGQVLASRWSSWVGIPVAGPAILVYLAAVAGTWLVGPNVAALRNRVGWMLLLPAAITAGGAAIWFIGLQVLSLGSFCWYCLTLHACGLLLLAVVAWRLPEEVLAGQLQMPKVAAAAIAGMAAIAILVVGQVLVEPHSEMKVVTIEAPSSTAKSSAADEAPAGATTREPNHPWPHRRLSLLAGAASLDLYDYPVIGDREADRPLVEVFDYTCPHCRELYVLLEKVKPDYGDALALVLLPMPMTSKCNPHVRSDDPKHATACELTRIAIAVWQAKPEAFAGFHAWMMKGKEPPSPAAAEAEAAKRIGAETFQKALSDPAVEAQLLENCRIYTLAREGSGDGSIPKLIYDKSVSTGLPASEQALRSFLTNRVGL